MADLKHLLRHRLWKEHVVDLKTDKVFCSQWLNDRQVVFGTKCNKLMLYDTTRQVLDQIPLLNGRLNASAGFGYTAETQIGIGSAQINPFRTLLATRGKNSTELAIYKLPSLDPFCVGEQGHKDWIIGPCWLDDEFLVSASNDSKMTLWKIKRDSSDGTSEKRGVSTHRFRYRRVYTPGTPPKRDMEGKSQPTNSQMEWRMDNLENALERHSDILDNHAEIIRDQTVAILDMKENIDNLNTVIQKLTEQIGKLT
ncbi:DDB1- and CUL4-associated factor 12-like [Nasonia vitripennis]|uniref:DDB1- and CUL4-associated factor 12 beta-propeller domain-containing protein n=1 Tax=Nasonia vitripennis TaxID=7425 RepID=A0A7M7T652_NASVI|nr:DDB1- and CUL4-associated factor 12-like [Nasonia vitripennis]